VSPTVTTPADHKGRVDFAILTIREDEFQAVLDRFPPFTRAKGRRVYNLHRLDLKGGGAYLVAVVKCIEQGNAEALDTVRDALEELEPRWVLAVGIAAGVPSDELMLGDVVISTRIIDFSVEAVLQDQPSEYALMGGPVHKDAAAVVANLRALADELQGWSSATSIGALRPRLEIDESELYGDEAWQRRAREGLARQAARAEPIVAPGAVGSSDRLVKDTKILANFLLKAARQVLAVEMESAGMYRAATGRAVPSLTIRGLSDVVGFKRDPGWTAYACHSAAAFTRAFLQTRPIEPRPSALRQPALAFHTGMTRPLPPNNLPPRRRFVERDELLQALDRVLASSETPAPDQAAVRRSSPDLTPTASLYGLAGVGKTALAIEYAHRAAERGMFAGGIWWIGADATPTDTFVRLASVLVLLASDSVRSLLKDALSLDPSAANLALAVRLALQNQPLPSLLLLDNVSAAGWGEHIPAGRVRVLVTTRDERLALGLRLRVDVLSLAQAVDLANTLAPVSPEMNDDAAARDRVLVDHLGALPVAVEIAGHAVSRWALSWAGYERHLRSEVERVLDDPELRSEHYPLGVFAALSLSIERCGKDSPEAKLLLGATAFAAEGVPLKWAAAAAGLDEIGIDTARARTLLARLGLVSVNENAASISVHRLVHRQVRRQGLGQELWIDVNQRAADHAAQWLAQVVDPTRTAEIDAMRRHIDAALVAADAAGRTRVWIKIAHGLGRHLRHRGLYSEAQSLFEQALERVRKLSPGDPGLLAASLENVGLTYLDGRRPSSAHPFLVQALTIAERAYGPDHGKIVVFLANLAAAQKAQSLPAAALLLLKRALAIAERVYGREHRRVVTILSNLATVLQDVGKMEEASAALERSLEIGASVYGSPHPQIAAILSNLATLKIASGAVAEARSVIVEALSMSEVVHGPEHPQVAHILSVLAAALEKLGDEPGASQARARAIAIEQRFGLRSRLGSPAGWTGVGDPETETVDIHTMSLMPSPVDNPENGQLTATPASTDHEVTVSLNAASVPEVSEPTAAGEGRRTAVSTILPIMQAINDPVPELACLVVIYGADLGRRIPLDAEEIECGYRAQNAIRFEDDALSRRHARFTRKGSSYIVSDLGSTNGTFVNDESVREKTLHDGDEIKMGLTIVKFLRGDQVDLHYHEEIYRLMTFDGLTRVHNKRSFESAIEREVSRSHRYLRPLSLILFDIDHFKKINEERGRIMGDAVLRQLAALVVAKVRREDIVARVGGEAFAILLPEVALDVARPVGETLRALIERTPCRFEDETVPLTVSFGVAELVADPPMGPKELYQLADERLHEAKRRGRNRVV
jgi:diguanylate cyclase (GGDEF)-like protein